MDKKDIIILDGGMGRELARRGAPFRQPEWSALALTEAPEAVVQTHLDFIRAGSQVITANSYAVVPFHIGDRFEREAQTLADTAGRLARQAAGESGRPVRVAASLPPLFGSYRPDLFDVTKAPVLAQPLVQGLSPHVDIWLAETQSSVAEAAFWRTQLPRMASPSGPPSRWKTPSHMRNPYCAPVNGFPTPYAPWPPWGPRPCSSTAACRK